MTTHPTYHLSVVDLELLIDGHRRKADYYTRIAKRTSTDVNTLARDGLIAAAQEHNDNWLYWSTMLRDRPVRLDD